MRVILIGLIVSFVVTHYFQWRMRRYLSAEERWGRALWLGPWMPDTAFTAGGMRYRDAARIAFVLTVLLGLACAIYAFTRL